MIGKVSSAIRRAPAARRRATAARLVRTTVYVVGLLCVFAPSAFTYNCPYETPDEAIRGSPIAFTGSVVEKRLVDGTEAAIFRVEKSWKGGTSEIVSVFPDPPQHWPFPCGPAFSVGKTYLVLASPLNSSDSGVLVARTEPYAQDPNEMVTLLEIYQARLITLMSAATEGSSTDVLNLGLFYLDQNQSDEAIRMFSQLLNPQSAGTKDIAIDAHLYRAMAHFRLQQVDSAIADLEAIPPDNRRHDDVEFPLKNLRALVSERMSAPARNHAWYSAWRAAHWTYRAVSTSTPDAVCGEVDAKKWLPAIMAGDVPMIDDRQDFLDRALFHFIEMKCIDTVVALLASGVNPNVRDRCGRVPLHHVGARDPEMTDVL